MNHPSKPRISTDRQLWFLTLLFGLFMGLGWVPLPLPFLLFGGFVPLLLIEHKISIKYPDGGKAILFEHIYVAFLIWNVATTWWVSYASLLAGIFAILANSLLMCIPFMLFRSAKKHLGYRVGYASFIILWMCYEFLHHRWELTWPWLTLGNGLATFPILAQWYEYTGTLGGTFWILIVNLLIFFLYQAWQFQKQLHWGLLSLLLAAVLFPAMLSVYIFRTTSSTTKKRVEVVVIQPDIDPYDKFGAMSKREQINLMLVMTEKVITPKTKYVLWPETSVQGRIFLESLKDNKIVRILRQFMTHHPQATLITGTFAFRNYPNGEGASATSRNYSDGRCCYDAYNSAIQIDTTAATPVYHKSKLVPGVERMPYPAIFKILESFTVKLGGISGSLSTQPERTAFVSKEGTAVGPIICYESIFGEFVTDYIKKGAETLFILTNDGWWDDTPGHRQHLRYASLRAIETRRSIARCANTGISSFIDLRGTIRQATKYNEQKAIKQEISLNNETTFYVKYGDYLGIVASLLSLFTMMMTIVFKATARK